MPVKCCSDRLRPMIEEFDAQGIAPEDILMIDLQGRLPRVQIPGATLRRLENDGGPLADIAGWGLTLTRNGVVFWSVS